MATANSSPSVETSKRMSVKTLIESPGLTSLPGSYSSNPNESAVSKPDEDIFPIIDFPSPTSDDPHQRSNKSIQDLDRACQDGGFFTLVNHGVPEKSMKAEFHFPNKPKGFRAKTMCMGIIRLLALALLVLMMVSPCIAAATNETAAGNYHPASDTPRDDPDPHH